MKSVDKVIHRIYFPDFKPYFDPFEHYLETWREQMPDYEIKIWNRSNLDVFENEWTRTANENASPVFLSEYYRWKVLKEYGGLYLDADCEVLNGQVLNGIFEELQIAADYDCFFGVEEFANGHPTAQTFGARKGAELVDFMIDLYENRLNPLWPWREKRGLIGPQLMSLFFLGKGVNVQDDGFFKNLQSPVVRSRAKVYPQEYFSPKFSLLGGDLNFDKEKTCVYHMFANSNVDFSRDKRRAKAQTQALRFDEYRASIKEALSFPRSYEADCFVLGGAEFDGANAVSTTSTGLMFYGPYCVMPGGDYVARIHGAPLPSSGTLSISITARSGEVKLASRVVSMQPGMTHVDVAFHVTGPSLADVEVVAHVREIDTFAFEKVVIHEARALQSSLAAGPDSSPNLKTLHRIYFGFDGKPDPFLNYLSSWKEELPDFTIVHWNASNLPMNICSYVERLYAEKDHAFLTDYFRWYLLREYGGVYLDADVEIVDGAIFQRIIEELERADDFDAVIGIDERGGGWYTAHSMASKPGSDLSRFMCSLYEGMGPLALWRKQSFNFWAPQLTSLFFAENGHNKQGFGTSPNLDAPAIAARVKIYPQDWFAPLAPTGDPDHPFVISGLSGNSCICHHFACSWHDEGSVYLAHSRARGGQLGVSLSDVLLEQSVHRFKASGPALLTEAGRKTPEGIVATEKEGYLAFGPYTTLIPGTYTAYFLFDDVRALSGIADVTSEGGQNVLAQRRVTRADLSDEAFSLAFTVDEYATGVELRLHVDRGTRVRLTEIVVVQNSVRAFELPGKERLARKPMDIIEDIHLGVGERTESGGVTTTGRAGCLSYGPYISLPPGSYEAIVISSRAEQPVGFGMDVVSGFGDVSICDKLDLSMISAGQVQTVGFDLAKVYDNVEFRFHVEEATDLSIDHVLVVRKEHGLDVEAFVVSLQG